MNHPIGCHGRHDPNATPIPQPGLNLCTRCHTQLRHALQDITTLWPLLQHLTQPGNGLSHSSGKPGSRPPCNLDVTDLTDPRGTIHQQIVGWAQLVIEDRQFAQRTLDVDQAARLLQIHADWLAAQPFIGDALLEIRDAAWHIRRACHDLPDPPLGTCPDIDPTGQSDRCGGPMRWNDGTASVVCGRCGSTWAEADMPHLLRVIQPTRRFPVPRTWVALHYNIAAGTLRQWIRRGHIRTYNDQQVELLDVLKRVTEG